MPFQPAQISAGGCINLGGCADLDHLGIACQLRTYVMELTTKDCLEIGRNGAVSASGFGARPALEEILVQSWPDPPPWT